MKKLFIVSVLFWGLQTFAQKTVYIFNFSNEPVQISDIATQSINNFYPLFFSDPSSGPITLPPFDPMDPDASNYILVADPVSTTKFPFNSPSNTPPIDKWKRQLSAGTSGGSLSSILVATIYGSSQSMYAFKSSVGINGSLGAGTLYPTASNNFSDFYLFMGGSVSLDVIDATGNPAPDGETYIIITD